MTTVWIAGQAQLRTLQGAGPDWESGNEMNVWPSIVVVGLPTGAADAQVPLPTPTPPPPPR